MNNTLITKLAKAVGTSGELSKDHAKTIINNLKSKELNLLKRALKKESLKNTILVLSAEKLTNSEQKEINRMFVGKRVIFHEDFTIGAGIKIKTYDMIYDLSLNGEIKRLAESLN